MEIILSEEVQAYIIGLSSSTEKAQIAQYLDRQEELGHRLKEPVSKAKSSLFMHLERKRKKTPDYEIKAAIRKRAEWERS